MAANSAGGRAADLHLSSTLLGIFMRSRKLNTKILGWPPQAHCEDAQRLHHESFVCTPLPRPKEKNPCESSSVQPVPTLTGSSVACVQLPDANPFPNLLPCGARGTAPTGFGRTGSGPEAGSCSQLQPKGAQAVGSAACGCPTTALSNRNLCGCKAAFCSPGTALIRGFAGIIIIAVICSVACLRVRWSSLTLSAAGCREGAPQI